MTVLLVGSCSHGFLLHASNRLAQDSAVDLLTTYIRNPLLRQEEANLHIQEHK